MSASFHAMVIADVEVYDCECALGDSTVNNQDPSGRIRTYWIPEAGDADPLAGAIRLPYGGDWYNCMASDVTALTMLSDGVCRLDRGGM